MVSNTPQDSLYLSLGFIVLLEVIQGLWIFLGLLVGVIQSESILEADSP